MPSIDPGNHGPVEDPARPADGQDTRATFPSETSLQNNLDRAMEYRREYYKYCIGIATALLAFTVSFPPQLSRAPDSPWLLFVGWSGLGLAVLAGVRVHMVWAKFFVSFRDFDNRGRLPEGIVRRRGLNAQRRFLDTVQMVGLVVGVASVVAFAGLNVRYLPLKKDDQGAALSSRKVEDPVAPSSAKSSSPAVAIPLPPVETGKP